MKGDMIYILCAAIHYDDDVVHNSQPDNIDSGYVITGRRHHDCKEIYRIFTGKKTDIEDIRGFITSDNRFLTRTEAFPVALAAGQIDHKSTKHPTELHSSDIY